jgi:hypothetical protein
MFERMRTGKLLLRCGMFVFVLLNLSCFLNPTGPKFSLTFQYLPVPPDQPKQVFKEAQLRFDFKYYVLQSGQEKIIENVKKGDHFWSLAFLIGVPPQRYELERGMRFIDKDMKLIVYYDTLQTLWLTKWE